MKFHTLNSEYEIDYDAKRVRRVSGINPPTPSFSPDGEWKEYVRAIPYYSGTILFIWPNGKTTITSKLVDHE